MTNIFKVDKPIRRSLYFIISVLISFFVIMEGQILQPWTIDVLNNNLILINLIEIPIALFFSYLFLMNDSKRLWDIIGNKKFAIITAAIACFIKILNDLLFFLNVIDIQVGFIIFGLLFIYYLFVLFLPKDSLALLAQKKTAEQETTDEEIQKEQE